MGPRPGLAEQLSKSRKKNLATMYKPFSESLYRDGPVLLSNSQAEPGRHFLQPRARLLVHLCMCSNVFWSECDFMVVTTAPELLLPSYSLCLSFSLFNRRRASEGPAALKLVNKRCTEATAVISLSLKQLARRNKSEFALRTI